MAKIIFVILSATIAQVLTGDSNFDVSNLTPVAGPDSKQYYINNFFKASWYKAYEFCRYNGMHLATFQTEADVVNMANYLIKAGFNNNRYWTSGNDLGESKRFVWGGDGRAITGNVWIPGEPNNSGLNGQTEHCVELVQNNIVNSYKLNDYPCAELDYMICEYVQDDHN